MGRLKDLRTLRVANNRFVGFLPSDLALMPELAQLLVQGNSLSGVLPSSFNEFQKLEILDFSDQTSLKKLTGPLPTFASCPQLRQINLSNNRFAGVIPSTFLAGVDKAAVINVNLANNELSGSIPMSFVDFQRLNINLASNLISGVPEILCHISGWMNGKVGTLRQEDACNAILCPPGTYGREGKQQQANEPCLTCNDTAEAPYFGSIACVPPSTQELPCISSGSSPYSGVMCSGSTSERGTLELLFGTTGGGGWNNSTRWMTDAPICSWDGVLCTGDAHDNEGIEVIDLASNRLTGTLPFEVWELPTLRRLNVRGNPDLLVAIGSGDSRPQLQDLLLWNTLIQTIDGVSRFVNLVELEFSGLAGR